MTPSIRMVLRALIAVLAAGGLVLGGWGIYEQVAGRDERKCWKVGGTIRVYEEPRDDAPYREEEAKVCAYDEDEIKLPTLPDRPEHMLPSLVARP